MLVVISVSRITMIMRCTPRPRTGSRPTEPAEVVLNCFVLFIFLCVFCLFLLFSGESHNDTRRGGFNFRNGACAVMYVCMSLSLSLSLSLYIYIYMYIHTYVYMYLLILLSVLFHICMFILCLLLSVSKPWEDPGCGGGEWRWPVAAMGSPPEARYYCYWYHYHCYYYYHYHYYYMYMYIYIYITFEHLEYVVQLSRTHCCFVLQRWSTQP